MGVDVVHQPLAEKLVFVNVVRIFKRLNLSEAANNVYHYLFEYGFQIEADNPLRIEKTKAIIDLAAEFDVSVVTTHIGVIPNDSEHPRYKTLLSAMTACGEYAKERGVTLAIETGPAPIGDIKLAKRFLDRLI